MHNVLASNVWPIVGPNKASTITGISLVWTPLIYSWNKWLRYSKKANICFHDRYHLKKQWFLSAPKVCCIAVRSNRSPPSLLHHFWNLVLYRIFGWVERKNYWWLWQYKRKFFFNHAYSCTIDIEYDKTIKLILVTDKKWQKTIYLIYEHTTVNYN